MKERIALMTIVCSLFAACGGGGGGSSPDPGPNRSPHPVTPISTDFSQITGLYDISTQRSGTTDAGFLFITAQGVFEVYNDLSDAFAGPAAMNCFRRAISGDVDFDLDSKQLQKNGAVFQLTLNGTTQSGMTIASL